jgi:hypoxanthine phosphoribosyltransferase
MTAIDPQLYIKKAELLYSEQVVNEAISTLAKQLNIDYADEAPVVMCVMGGGVFF